jgi:hypothetical protein
VWARICGREESRGFGLVGVFAAASARSGAAIGGHELIVRCVPITFDDRPTVASERQPATEFVFATVTPLPSTANNADTLLGSNLLGL